jgi:hypothetical protein
MEIKLDNGITRSIDIVPCPSNSFAVEYRGEELSPRGYYYSFPMFAAAMYDKECGNIITCPVTNIRFDARGYLCGGEILDRLTMKLLIRILYTAIRDGRRLINFTSQLNTQFKKRNIPIEEFARINIRNILSGDIISVTSDDGGINEFHYVWRNKHKSLTLSKEE